MGKKKMMLLKGLELMIPLRERELRPGVFSDWLRAPQDDFLLGERPGRV